MNKEILLMSISNFIFYHIFHTNIKGDVRIMFLSHYDKSFITCSNDQMNKLVTVTKILFRLYNKNIIEADIINAMFENDSIYYSAKFLFKSNKPVKDLHKNYCNLSRLIYIFYHGNNKELNYNIDTISNENLLNDLLY